MTRAEDIAWAAGLFEGEGCISLRDKPRALGKETRLKVSTTDLDVLQRFALIVGVGTIYGPYQRWPHHKPIWTWSSETAHEAIIVLRLLRPHLGDRRGVKADEAVEAAWRRIFRRMISAGKETPAGVKINGVPWSQFKAALGEE